jgi:hypothetical protein
VAVNVTDVPAHIAPAGLAAIDTLAAALALITTVVDPAALVHPATVTVTLYVPALAKVTPRILGVRDVELKLLGPVQAYVAPVTEGVDSVNNPPTQTGLLLEAVGVAGTGFTTTVVDPAALVHPPADTVTLYVPAAARVTPAIFGFCTAELKPFGPVQAYVAPLTAGVERFSVAPTHIGPLLDAVGVAGAALITTVVVPAALVQPPTVTVTLYTPPAARVTPVILGF